MDAHERTSAGEEKPAADGTDDRPSQPTHDDRLRYETDTTGDVHFNTDMGEIHFQTGPEDTIETFPVTGTHVPVTVRAGDTCNDGDYITATAQLTADQCERLARHLEELAAAAREAEEAADV